MTDQQLQKLGSLGILLTSYSKHAWTAGEGSMRDKFISEINEILKEIDTLLGK